MRNYQFITVSPSDYAIVFKSGKVIREGRGFRFFNTPAKQYVIIPAKVNNIAFVADQISKENQGVEVSGFAIWKVAEPQKIYKNFDFGSSDDTLLQVNEFLKDVVESAIRHMVANMTIEEVLRKRGTIILQLKKELEYISEQWGIMIETIEIKNVKVLSRTLFDNMQAKFRNAIRLESETSSLETEKQIEEQRLQFAEKTFETQQQSKRTELQRKKEIELLTLNDDAELTTHQQKQALQRRQNEMANTLSLLRQEEDNKRTMMSAQTETLQAQKQIDLLHAELELKKKELAAKLSEMDTAISKARIEANNLKNERLMLIEKLPDMLSNLSVDKLTLGENSLNQFLVELQEYFKTKK